MTETARPVLPKLDAEATTFDVVAHHRARTRKAEQRTAFLEAANESLIRKLALAVRIAAGQDCDAAVLMAAIEQMDELAQRAPERGLSTDELLEVLRETDPVRLSERDAA